LSSSDEDTQSSKIDVPSNRKGSTADDAGDKGTASAETLISGLIKTDAPGKPKPFVTDQASVKPPTSRRNQKCPCTAVKRPNPVPQADQVITQVELPPYCGPHNPLDLVIVEIIFGCIFQAFCRISQVAATGATPTIGDKPP
jgi:hypothetical protein